MKQHEKAGVGAGRFLGDLANGMSDEEMRKRWAAGEYPNVRPEDAREWRKLAGRTS